MQTLPHITFSPRHPLFTGKAATPGTHKGQPAHLGKPSSSAALPSAGCPVFTHQLPPETARRRASVRPATGSTTEQSRHRPGCARRSRRRCGACVRVRRRRYRRLAGSSPEAHTCRRVLTALYARVVIGKGTSGLSRTCGPCLLCAEVTVQDRSPCGRSRLGR